MTPFIFVFWGIGIFGFLAFWMFGINNYIVVWILAKWGIIDLAWADEFVALFWSWTNDLFYLDVFNELVTIPFEQLKFMLTRVEHEDEGYHF